MLKRFFKTEVIAAVFAVSAIGFVSCNNAGDGDRGAADEDYTAYRDYVSTANTDTTYYTRDWSELERDYNDRKAKVDAKADQLDEKTRAEYNEMEAEWNAFKTRYEARRAERENANIGADDRITVIRTRFIFPDAADYRYANLKAENTAEAYKRFFDNFKGEAQNYSEQEWQEIQEIYKALEERREAMKEEITPKDQDMINTIKKQYASIMANYRPFAESENKPQ